MVRRPARKERDLSDLDRDIEIIQTAWMKRTGVSTEVEGGDEA